MKYFYNPFNYHGSKNKLLEQIDNNLDYNKINLIEPFCGSAIVSTNLGGRFKNIFCYDKCWQLLFLINYLKLNRIDNIINNLEKEIKKRGLSKTNKEAYLELRREYNEKHRYKLDFNPIYFYLLICYSFSNNISFNSKSDFNTPFGMNKSSFNNSIKNKLIKYVEKLQENNIIFTYQDFCDFYIPPYINIKDTMFYIDPPYLLTDDAYSRCYGLKWNEEKEEKLYKNLDYINDKGGSFLLSNIIVKDNKVNNILEKWSEKYIVEEINTNYNNCNYQKKRDIKVKEIFVKNY